MGKGIFLFLAAMLAIIATLSIVVGVSATRPPLERRIAALVGASF